jgi:hypothetical protein
MFVLISTKSFLQQSTGENVCSLFLYTTLKYDDSITCNKYLFQTEYEDVRAKAIY